MREQRTEKRMWRFRILFYFYFFSLSYIMRERMYVHKAEVDWIWKMSLCGIFVLNRSRWVCLSWVRASKIIVLCMICKHSYRLWKKQVFDFNFCSAVRFVGQNKSKSKIKYAWACDTLPFQLHIVRTQTIESKFHNYLPVYIEQVYPIELYIQQIKPIEFDTNKKKPQTNLHACLGWHILRTPYLRRTKSIIPYHFN